MPVSRRVVQMLPEPMPTRIQSTSISFKNLYPEALQTLTIDDIAKKDVPTGVAYKIVDTLTIPEDRTFRGAWEADITEPDGVGLGYDAWFALQPKPIVHEVTE